MKNIFTGRFPEEQADVTPAQAEKIEIFRQIRRDARKAARSGNPAKAAPARELLVSVPYAIKAVLMGRG